MGVHANITATDFPRQSDQVGKRVLLTFQDDLDAAVEATLVRDDEESPNRTIVQMDDGRCVLAGRDIIGLVALNPRSLEEWPAQGDYLGRDTRVMFHYRREPTLHGTMVREDVNDVTIIQLDDGRFVTATECQYSPA